MEPAAFGRLAEIRGSLPDAIDEPGELVESWSNDVWVFPESVLRVCWLGDTERLLREVAVLDALPASVPHASVVGSGRAGGLTWMMLERLPGRRLDLVWPTLSKVQQERAIAQQGEILRELHRWSAPPDLIALLARKDPDSDVDQIVGSAIVPMPIDRALVVLEALDEDSLVTHELCRALRVRITELSPVFPAPDHHVVVHADAHFANYLHDGSAMTALLDFEWVTSGPPELELTAICRTDPDIRRLAVDGPVDAKQVRVLQGIGSSYPELVSGDDLTERVWLLEIVHHARELRSWARLSPESAADEVKLLASLTRAPRVIF